MELFFYTIDDMRRRRHWNMKHFRTVEEALDYYKTLPDTGQRALGLTNGFHVLELACCLPLFPDDEVGEDVLASDYTEFPFWASIPEAAEAVNACVRSLRIRYWLKGEQITPIPTAGGLPKNLRRLRLRDQTGNVSQTIQWIYVAGAGWISPAELQRRKSVRPLVLKYRVECVDEEGYIFMPEVTPWEYAQLGRQTEERNATGCVRS